MYIHIYNSLLTAQAISESVLDPSRIKKIVRNNEKIVSIETEKTVPKQLYSKFRYNIN